MTETYNINAHYTNKPKVEKTARIVAEAPDTIPKMHLYNEIDARKRLQKISKDVCVLTQKEERKPVKNFILTIGALGLSCLAFIGLKKLFRKS